MSSFQLVLFLVMGALIRSEPIAHIFSIIGQSNSIGFNTDGRTAEDVTYDNIFQTSCCNNGNATNDNCRLILGQDPLHHFCDTEYLNSQDVGFGMTFARELRDEICSEDVIVLVPAGVSGTGFVDKVWPAYTGSGFKVAVTRLQNTFKLVAKKFPKHTAVLRGYLWHQGEADAKVNTTTVDYLERDIIPMINAWRDTTLIRQTGPKVPFVVGNLVPSWVLDRNHTERLGVLVAIQVLDQFVPFTAVVPSQGLVGDQSEAPTPIHFSAKSQRLLGKRYFAGWKMAMLNSQV